MEGKIFLKRYRLCLGRNGRAMQVHRSPLAPTYRAQELTTGREVALSVITPKPREPAMLRRLEQRAGAAMRIHQINLPAVCEFGHDDEAFIFISELCDGPTAADWVAARGPLTLSEVLRVALQVLNALHVTGFDGVYHPTLNPENIVFLAERRIRDYWPEIRLVNWFLPAGNLAGSEAEFDGSTLFASPEQLHDGQLEMSSQVYSLGATMLFLLTGLAPISAPGVQPPAVHLRGIPQPIQNLLERMMRVNPEERPQDPLALAAHLHTYLARCERRERIVRQLALPVIATGRAAKRLVPSELPSKPLAIAAILLGVASAAAFVFLGPWQERPPLAAAPPIRMEAHAPNDGPAPPPKVQIPTPPSSRTVSSIQPTNKSQRHHPAIGKTVAARTSEAAPPAEGPVTNPRTTVARTHEAPIAVIQSPPVAESPSPPVEKFADATSPKSESADVTPPARKRTATKRKTKSVAERSHRHTISHHHSATLASSDKTSRFVREAKRAQPVPELHVGSAPAELVGTTSDGQWILSVSNTGERIVVPPPPGFTR